MKLLESLQPQRYYLTRHGLTQDEVNRVLRPGKRRFGRSTKRDPISYMHHVAHHELSRYRDPNRYRYHFYWAWKPELGPWQEERGGRYCNWELRINRAIPPQGPRVRVVDQDGDPIYEEVSYQRRVKRKGRKRRVTDFAEKKVQISLDARAGLEHSFFLLDHVFSLLERHMEVYVDGVSRDGEKVYGPFPVIYCRDSASYQSCNFSRFVPVWLIYINALTPEHFLTSHVVVNLSNVEVAPNFKNKKHARPKDINESSDLLESYKRHVYGIIHHGYNIWGDTKEVLPSKNKYIDGVHIFSRPVLEGGKVIGHCPDLPRIRNSGYMAEYMVPFVKQLKKWMGQHACVHIQAEPNYLWANPSGHLFCKITIEPKKPRLCYNARPLAGVMKRVPCKLDDLSVLLPLLKKGMYGCISDDKQGRGIIRPNDHIT